MYHFWALCSRGWSFNKFCSSRCRYSNSWFVSIIVMLSRKYIWFSEWIKFCPPHPNLSIPLLLQPWLSMHQYVHDSWNLWWYYRFVCSIQVYICGSLTSYKKYLPSFEDFFLVFHEQQNLCNRIKTNIHLWKCYG